MGIFIRNRYESVLLDTEEVLYALNDKRRVIVYTDDKSYWAYCSMEHILEQADERIYRCHYSLAVNLDQIKGINESGVLLMNGAKLTMCRAALRQTKKVWLSHIEK